MTTVEEAVSQFTDVEDELIFLPAIPDKDPELANPENAPGGSRPIRVPFSLIWPSPVLFTAPSFLI